MSSDRAIPTARIVETGTSRYSGVDLLLPSRDETPPSAQAEAIAFLRAELADGPRSVQEMRAATEEAQLSWDTVKSAKAKAGVTAHKQRGVQNGGWYWTLADPAPPKDGAAA